MRCVLLLAITTVAFAATASAADLKGSKDHPLLPRYEGAEISYCDVKAFEEATIFVKPPLRSGREPAPGVMQRVEGRVTTLAYQIPKGRSPLEVFRNYETAMKASGYTILVSCTGPEQCGDGVETLIKRASTYGGAVRYIAGRRADGVLAAVTVYPRGPDTSVEASIVEPAKMEQKISIVDAAGLERDMASKGRALLYAIRFDTDKTEIRPESKPQLAEIAAYVARSKRPVLIVGHTDGTGDYAYNVKLSQGRAAAVVAALASDHGVARALLTPVGVGMAAPVATNRTAAGQALNRRVEIVERSK